MPGQEIKTLLRDKDFDDRERFVIVTVDQFLFQLEIASVNILLFRLVAIAEEDAAFAQLLKKRVAAERQAENLRRLPDIDLLVGVEHLVHKFGFGRESGTCLWACSSCCFCLAIV